jgi:hypothetical protein
VRRKKGGREKEIEMFSLSNEVEPEERGKEREKISASPLQYGWVGV